MKSKKDKKFKLLFALLAVIIAFNISLVYITAPKSSAEEEIIIEDSVIDVDTTGKVPEFESAIDCYLYAEAKLASTTCYSTITGYVKGIALGNTMVHQTMKNTRVTDNNGYKYSTSLSDKQGSLGKNNYQKIAFDTKSENGYIYKMVTEKLNSDGSPNYDGCTWQKFSQTEYTNAYGSLPGTISYTVRPSTIKKVELFEKLEDGSYHIKFVLNNRSAVVNYKKLVKISAGSFATGYPAFSSVCAEVWVDANGNFKKYIMDDTATIPMGVSIASLDCTMISHYEETFEIMGGNVEQPFEVPFLQK